MHISCSRRAVGLMVLFELARIAAASARHLASGRQ